jgi:hypothetical protein
MSYSSSIPDSEIEACFYLRIEGEGLIRADSSGVAYLRAYGWVRPRRQSKLQLLVADSIAGKREGSLWRGCTQSEARTYALRLFNDVCLDEPALDLGKRIGAFLQSQDLRGRRRPVPYGPAPWRISRETQEETQRLEVSNLPSRYGRFSVRMEDWIAQAQEGYEQERSRIEGIQQRASFILGASGVTTAGVLANGSLLIGKDAFSALSAKLTVGVLLTAATVALVGAAYSALEATMVLFELAQPSSPWQLERRIHKLGHEEESRYVLATTLLAARRAEAIGDWKVRRLRQARRRFTAAIVSVAVANVAALVFLPSS